MTQTAHADVVLRSFKCLSCLERTHNVFLDEMPQLTDTIPVPPAYAKAFAWPDECSVAPGLVKHLRKSKVILKSGELVAVPTVRVRLVDGELECYAYAPALVLCERARSRVFPTEFPVFKYGQKTYYKVDGALLDQIKATEGKHKQSIHATGARVRCEEQLRTLKNDEIAKFLTREWESTHGPDREDDISAVHNKIVKLYSVLHQAGREEVLKSHRRITEHYGISVQAPVELPFQKKPAEFNAVSWWKDACKKSQGPFSLTGEDAYAFRKDQTLGIHRQLHLTYVPPRPTTVQYVFQLAPDYTWDCKDDKKTLNTLQRVLWEIEAFNKERVELFTSQFSEETLKAMGHNASFVLRREGDTRVIDPMNFLRGGLLGCIIYTATVPTKDIRKAILLNNVGSLATKILQVDPSAAAELEHLSLIYNKLFDAADFVHKLKQQKRSEVSEGLPKAEELLVFMRALDMKEKSPEEFYLLAFLGLAYFLGLRSGEMGILMSLLFRNQDLSNYHMLIADEDNRLVFSSFQCKTRVNDLKTVPLPAWLEKWVRDYELHGRPSLLRGQTHMGMWVTATGLPTHHSIIGKESNHGSEFRYILKLLETHFGKSTISDFTDLRAIFFNGEGEDCEGSMLNLIARAQEYLPNKRQKTAAPVLEDKEGLKKAMAELFRSKSQDEYTKKCTTPIKYICERLDAVKRCLWEGEP